MTMSSLKQAMQNIGQVVGELEKSVATRRKQRARSLTRSGAGSGKYDVEGYRNDEQWRGSSWPGR